MDTRRLILATVVSALVLLGFDYFMPKNPPPPPVHGTVQAGQTVPADSHIQTQAKPATPETAPDETGPELRLAVDAKDVMGSVRLRGALLDDLVLKQYRQTVKSDSPLVRVLETPGKPRPDFVEFGWIPAESSVKVPDRHTLWKADSDKLTSAHPVTLSWDNGAGLLFTIRLAVDDDYMFTIEQNVRNTTGSAVQLTPYSHVLRGYTPEETGGMLVHEGPISVVNGRMTEESYKSLREGSVAPADISWSKQGTGGWAGITDKYWLMAVVPDQAEAVTGTYGYDAASTQYRVGFVGQAPLTIGAGDSAASTMHVFAGAKEVRLLERYQSDLHIPDFWKAVDFGWLAFLTRPVFYVLDWLYTHLGNFGLALLTFTLIVKILFFPLAMKSFRSAAAMRDLQPKIQDIRARHKDDPVAMNMAVMQLYRESGANPASGCLPLLIQAPVFWCLYKDLYVTIEMRQAPFFGWIRDLSAPDPTNIFNLFGLLPFDPTHLSGFLLLGIWPILYGLTMYGMQKASPAVLDPAQQRIFMMMPVMFTFFMARQPVGLVIYYCWNNVLTIAQQLMIQRTHKAVATGPGVISGTAREKTVKNPQITKKK
ncbi:membrane protein insertase YidC [Acetobacter sp. AN02]|uniref:membrane protein insertase YidC n=1 Tax=Acetobacter sp. AN02 TaxID=2894186 RepID=UPI0024342593|nr:membrane protein insertase YidC [Acetobacter sp. AN02]MDG6094171.1 membrane protein insertase YidC [Acetobacter sp. AN02]